MIRFLLLALCCAPAFADTYAGLQQREIKALTAEEMQGYLEAKGMGLAKAAELNGYPGPSHVLEHADALGLDPAQREATRAIFATMRERAMAAGVRLVAQERELDRRFASGHIDAAGLSAALAQIAATQAEIRGAHLSAHLEQKALLSARQIAAYNRLRGYDAPAAHRSHAH